MTKYGVISGPYFPVFGLNTRKYGPELTLYLDTLHRVQRQPSVGFLNKRCSENIIEITLRRGCSPVNLLHIFRASFPKNTYEELLLVKR